MKIKVLSAIGIVVLLYAVARYDFDLNNSDSFSRALYWMGEQQEQLAEDATIKAVGGLEGDLVGEHEIDGSNWALPNIIANAFG